MSLVTLGVADLARARKFYEEVLGWKAAESPPRRTPLGGGAQSVPDSARGWTGDNDEGQLTVLRILPIEPIEPIKTS